MDGRNRSQRVQTTPIPSHLNVAIKYFPIYCSAHSWNSSLSHAATTQERWTWLRDAHWKKQKRPNRQEEPEAKRQDVIRRQSSPVESWPAVKCVCGVTVFRNHHYDIWRQADQRGECWRHCGLSPLITPNESQWFLHTALLPLVFKGSSS